MIIVILFCSWKSEALVSKDVPSVCIHLGDYVDCASRNLDAIPDNIPTWTRKLNLNNNTIKNLTGDAWRNLNQIIELKLNKNKIQSLVKDTFKNMKRLKILEINRNVLDSIEPLSFQQLELVSALKLRRNRIKYLKDGTFFGLTKIHSLALDFNLVQVIEKSWLYGLDNLKELSLSHNAIQTIDNDAWEFCKDLEELDLAFNLLNSIERDTFKDLSKLHTLLLSNNNITFIEENAFYHTQNLKILNLSNNKISWTIEDAQGVFSGLTNLVKFHIASNDIKSINNKAFTGLHKVTYLDLKDNNITAIKENAFAEMLSLKELLLNTNSLLCDCNLLWFYEYLKLKRLEASTICAYPDWLRGQQLLKVPSSNLTCADGLTPVINNVFQPQIIALKGADISLSCTATSSVSMLFQWKKDNLELQNSDASVITSSVGKNRQTVSFFNITRIQHSDAGKYQCVVSNSYGTTYSQKTQISVLIYPTFNTMPSNITVRAGTTARLDCSASGEPQPEIAWQKDGGNDFPAARERRMQVMPADDVFFIMNAKPSDMGVYSCTAKNAAGKIVANATLSIEEKPSFVKPMENKEVALGETVVIHCYASGAPKPSICWYKDGLPIVITERHFFTAEEQMMIIVDTVLSDGGDYSCRLNNSLGIETGSCKVNVKPVFMSNSDLWGIIIITVVACAVFTSVVWVVIIYQTRRRMDAVNAVQPPNVPIMLDFDANIINQYHADNTSEHSSCKDSGTGDSAKRSNDDLLPGDEYTFIINDANTGDKNTTMRTASLVYLPAETNNSLTPLLHLNNSSYPRSTNHDRSDSNHENDINAITIDTPKG